MTQEQWTAVDRYFTDLFLPPDPALDAALTSSTAAGLPAIQVSAQQGQLLRLLATIQQPRLILEIGTLGGYSTICLARALPPDGRLISLEADPKHADVARANIARAGLADRVEVRTGPALDTLPVLESEKHGPFDLIFIDADKPNNPHYFTWALKLARRGTLILVDNIVRGGEVLDDSGSDPGVEGVRQLSNLIHAEPRVRAAAIQTVGVKGYDGLALIVVTGD